MTINSCLRRAQRLHGTRIAIHHQDRQITYREFSGIVENSARKLLALGAAKGDRVAVLMLNSPEDLARMLPQRAPQFRPGAGLPGRPGWKLEELLGAGGASDN